MALIERVIAQATQIRTGTVYTLRILQEEFPALNEPDLLLGESPFVISLEDEESGDSPHWSVGYTTLNISVVDDYGRMSFVQTIDEQELYVTLESGGAGIVFDGWVVPGVEYSYDRHGRTVVRFAAERGNNLMRQVPYTDSSGALLTGYESVLGIIKNAISKSNISWPFRTSVHWVPFLQTTQFISTDDTLKNILAYQDALINDDGNPFRAFDVLRLAARIFQCHVFIWGRHIYALQRKRVNVSNAFNVHNHPFDLSSTPTIELLDYSVDIWSDDHTTLGEVSIGFTVPFRGASIIYNHDVPTAGLLGNPSFEEEIATSGAGNWISTAPNVTSQRVNEPFPDGDLSNNFSYELGALYFDDTAPTPMTDPHTQVRVTDYIDQVLDGVIEGGADRTLQLQLSVKYNTLSGSITGTGNGFITIEIEINGYFLYRDAADFNNYLWATSPPSNQEKIYFEFLPGSWQQISITSAPLDDVGTPITGVPRMRIYAPTEDYNGSATPGADSAQFDLISIDVLGADGSSENAATLTSAVYADSLNYRTPENEVVLWGDGPTSGHNRRFKVIDGAGVEQDTTGDWQYGRTFTSESGVGHSEFWSRELLKQRAHALMRASFSIQLDDTNEFKPYALWRDERRFELTQAMNTDDTTIRIGRVPDGDKRYVGSPVRLRNVEVSGETHRVLWCILEDDDEKSPEWTLHLETPIVLGASAGTLVTQEFFFTNKRVEVDIIESIISVEAIEILEGAEPDVVCSYNVKPGSVQASALDISEGVPCFTEISQFSEPRIFFVGTDNNFYHMTGSFSDETNTGLDLTGQDIQDIKRHPTNGLIYGLAANGDVWTWLPDGTGLTNLFSSGHGDFSHISIQESSGNIILSRHQVAAINNRTYVYDSAGNPLNNWFNNDGAGAIGPGFDVSGEYIYTSTNSTEIHRMAVSTGQVNTLQSYPGIESGGELFSPLEQVVYGVVGSIMVRFEISVINNPNDAIQVGSGLPSTNNDHLAIFRHGGESFIVGCSAGQIWSFSLFSKNVVLNRSAANAKAITTRIT